MELVFVRHGEPSWVLDGRPQMDPPLTDRGLAQAARAAERLASGHRKPREILVSSARRARETAQRIADATQIVPTVIDELTELKLPDWSDIPPMEVANHFRNARARKLDDWWHGMPGGETFHAFQERIGQCITSILRDRGVERDEASHKHLYKQVGDPGRIVIVAHGGTNSVAMSLLLGMETVPWEWERIALNHASFVRMRTIPLGGGSVFSLRSQNDVEHLPQEMRTR